MLFDIFMLRKSFSDDFFTFLWKLYGEFFEIFRIVFCRRSSMINDYSREKKTYEKAKDRYYKELDIVELLKKIHEFNNFYKLFLTDEQQILLKLGA